MNGIRVPEQVVQISQNLLVSPNEEYPEIIRFLPVQVMYRKVVREITRRDKIIYLPVGVASDIL